VSQVSQVSQKF